jgi:hypothetical protein
MSFRKTCRVEATDTRSMVAYQFSSAATKRGLAGTAKSAPSANNHSKFATPSSRLDATAPAPPPAICIIARSPCFRQSAAVDTSDRSPCAQLIAPSRAIHGQGIALNTISQPLAGFHGGGTGDTTLDMHVLNVGLRVSW